MKNFILFCTALFFLLTVSCKTTEYVPIEKVKTEYISSSDTVIIRDSIYINQYTKGDTVYIDRDKYHNRILIQNDTIVRIDSIPVIKEVEKNVYIEKKLNIIQKSLMGIGGLVLVLLVFWITVKAVTGRFI